MGLFDFLKGKKRNWNNIIDVTDSNFKQQVINRSHKEPVLVDFWTDN